MIPSYKIDENYKIWIRLLKKYNLYSDELIEKYGELIKKGSYSLNLDSGLCYEGSLLDVTLKLPTTAMEINKAMSSVTDIELIPKENIIRACLLQHISKSILFVDQTNDWSRKKGYMYEFNKDLGTSLKVGERSIYMCMECGIKLTEPEYEAIRIIDKSEDDDSLFYSSILSNIIKMSNYIINFDGKEKYKKLNKIKKEIEE